MFFEVELGVLACYILPFVFALLVVEPPLGIKRTVNYHVQPSNNDCLYMYIYINENMVMIYKLKGFFGAAVAYKPPWGRGEHVAQSHLPVHEMSGWYI